MVCCRVLVDSIGEAEFSSDNFAGVIVGASVAFLEVEEEATARGGACFLFFVWFLRIFFLAADRVVKVDLTVRLLFLVVVAVDFLVVVFFDLVVVGRGGMEFSLSFVFRTFVRFDTSAVVSCCASIIMRCSSFFFNG